MKVVGKTGLDLTPELTGAVKERIKELILGSAVVLFSKSYCPFCTKTKALFAEIGAQEVCSIELDKDFNATAEHADRLIMCTGRHTFSKVPSIDHSALT